MKKKILTSILLLACALSSGNAQEKTIFDFFGEMLNWISSIEAKITSINDRETLKKILRTAADLNMLLDELYEKKTTFFNFVLDSKFDQSEKYHDELSSSYFRIDDKLRELSVVIYQSETINLEEFYQSISRVFNANRIYTKGELIAIVLKGKARSEILLVRDKSLDNTDKMQKVTNEIKSKVRAKLQQLNG